MAARKLSHLAVAQSVLITAALLLTFVSAPALSADLGPAEPLRAQITRLDASGFPTVCAFVSVTDAAGGSVLGLARESFTVQEDGRESVGFGLQSQLQEWRGAAVALVLDRSGSMRGEPFAAAVRAANDFAARLSDRDGLTVLTFAGRPDPPQPPSTDHEAMLRRFDEVHPGGETALYDAIQAAAEELSRSPADPKVVIALTDGRDNASAASAAACASAAEAAGVNVYCVGLGKRADRGLLAGIADKTGGSALFAASPGELTALYRRIAGRLRNQYALTYVSASPRSAGPWRTVSVSVSDGGATASDRKQYLVPGGTAPGEGPASTAVPPLLLAVAAAGAGNAALVAAVVARRRRSVRR